VDAFAGAEGGRGGGVLEVKIGGGVGAVGSFWSF